MSVLRHARQSRRCWACWHRAACSTSASCRPWLSVAAPRRGRDADQPGRATPIAVRGRRGRRRALPDGAPRAARRSTIVRRGGPHGRAWSIDADALAAHGRRARMAPTRLRGPRRALERDRGRRQTPVSPLWVAGRRWPRRRRRSTTTSGPCSTARQPLVSPSDRLAGPDVDRSAPNTAYMRRPSSASSGAPARCVGVTSTSRRRVGRRPRRAPRSSGRARGQRGSLSLARPARRRRRALDVALVESVGARRLPPTHGLRTQRAPARGWRAGARQGRACGPCGPRTGCRRRPAWRPGPRRASAARRAGRSPTCRSGRRRAG